MNLPQLPHLEPSRVCHIRSCSNASRRRMTVEQNGYRTVVYLCDPHWFERQEPARWPFEDVP